MKVVKTHDGGYELIRTVGTEDRLVVNDGAFRYCPHRRRLIEAQEGPRQLVKEVQQSVWQLVERTVPTIGVPPPPPPFPSTGAGGECHLMYPEQDPVERGYGMQAGRCIANPYAHGFQKNQMAASSGDSPMTAVKSPPMCPQTWQRHADRDSGYQRAFRGLADAYSNSCANPQACTEEPCRQEREAEVERTYLGQKRDRSHDSSTVNWGGEDEESSSSSSSSAASGSVSSQEGISDEAKPESLRQVWRPYVTREIRDRLREGGFPERAIPPAED